MPVPAHRRPASRKRRKALAAALGSVAVLVGAGLLGVGQPWANAAANVSFDTGTGLAFTINGTNGTMTSLKHNGTELTASGFAAGQFESGFSSATVTSKSFNNGSSILVSVASASTGVTQYYFARKNDNTVYMATNISKALNPGEARFIARLKPSLLTTSPAAAKTGGFGATVEGSDVFANSARRTASKFYSSQRLVAQKPFGASGSNAQRGGVSGTASGTWNGLTATVGLAGANGQYWGQVKAGKFVIGHVKPGTYTATLYAGELAVGATRSITVTAGATTPLAMTGSVPAAGTLFQLGTFDGTPAGFLNADRIETMHPSDSRMSAWKSSGYTVSAGAAKFPMAEFKSVNSPAALSFTLGSVPANGVKLRIATTSSFAGGRPAVAIGGYTSPASASPAPANLNSRNVTRGTWRGINTTYTFTIPASALKAGSNTLSISVVSGSSGETFLSPNFIFDALALDPA